MTVEAWFMDSSDEDQRKPHRLSPNQPVSLDQLKELGVFYWKLNADIYETDPELEQIRKDHGYSYMDIITIRKDTLPNYGEKAYFDVRDKEDRWIRIAMRKGDLITLPAGIYHRFTLDETNYTKAMRLFVGEPVWKAYNRPADDFDIRQKYVASLQES
ncbi:hypothetical protein INR49_014759 [Caranx melampygus]|nr:hypothetical protein INR49_014759 [Caranx melampygus]